MPLTRSYQRPKISAGEQLATLVIDCGSSEFRAGFATDETPTVCFRTSVLRYREKRGMELCRFVGSANLFAESPMENGIIVHEEYMEDVLDCAFHKLNVSNTHPSLQVASTEPACAPVVSRQIMIELLFEKYGVGSYGHVVNTLAALRDILGEDCYSTSSAAALNLSHSASTFIQLLDGAPQFHLSCRSPLGVSVLSDHLLELLTAKFPELAPALNYNDAHSLFVENCYFATKYTDDAQRVINSPPKIVKIPNPIAVDTVVNSSITNAKIEAHKIVEIGSRIAGYTHDIPDLVQARNKQANIHNGSADSLSKIELTESEQSELNENRDEFLKGLVHELEDLRATREIYELELIDKSNKDSTKRKLQIAHEVQNADTKEASDDENSDFEIESICGNNLGSSLKNAGPIGKESFWRRLARVEQLLAQLDPLGFFRRKTHPLIMQLAYPESAFDEAAKGEAILLNMGVEAFRAPEALFYPKLMGFGISGVAEMMAGATTVYLTGGGAVIPGLVERLQIELQREAKDSRDVSVVNAYQSGRSAEHSAWRGLRKICQQEKTRVPWIDRATYEEQGLRAILSLSRTESNGISNSVSPFIYSNQI